MKTYSIDLTRVELQQLQQLLTDANIRGEYTGNRDLYWKRHLRMEWEIRSALVDAAAVESHAKRKRKREAKKR